MKTIRVQYSSKQNFDTGLSKTFVLEEGKIITPKIQNCYAVVVAENLVDMLVPDDFDFTLIDGTVVKPADDMVKHEFLGHQTTLRVIDSTGKIETIEDITINK